MSKKGIKQVANIYNEIQCLSNNLAIQGLNLLEEGHVEEGKQDLALAVLLNKMKEKTTKAFNLITVNKFTVDWTNERWD